MVLGRYIVFGYLDPRGNGKPLGVVLTPYMERLTGVLDIDSQTIHERLLVLITSLAIAASFCCVYIYTYLLHPLENNKV